MLEFLKPKILEEVDSKYSGRIKVVKNLGDVYVATGPLTQSGGLVREVWEEVLKKSGKSHSSWLILGLAGGTIAKIVSDKFSPQKIVGVEIDPEMVRLGKKYLDLNKIPNLDIVITDAKKYISDQKSGFDFILVDMYFGDRLPAFVYDPGFLGRLKSLGSTVIFNHLFYDESKRAYAQDLVGKLKILFPAVTLSRKLTNLLITCQSAAA